MAEFILATETNPRPKRKFPAVIKAWDEISRPVSRIEDTDHILNIMAAAVYSRLSPRSTLLRKAESVIILPHSVVFTTESPKNIGKRLQGMEVPIEIVGLDANAENATYELPASTYDRFRTASGAVRIFLPAFTALHCDS